MLDKKGKYLKNFDFPVGSFLTETGALCPGKIKFERGKMKRIFYTLSLLPIHVWPAALFYLDQTKRQGRDNSSQCLTVLQGKKLYF